MGLLAVGMVVGDSTSTLFLLFNHALTPEQYADALASLGAGAVVVSPEGVLGLKPSQALWRRGGRHSGDEQQNHLFENYAFKLQIILMWIARIYKMILHDVLLPFSAVVLAGAIQAGNSPLARHVFPEDGSISLDRPSPSTQPSRCRTCFTDKIAKPLIIGAVHCPAAVLSALLVCRTPHAHDLDAIGKAVPVDRLTDYLP